MPALRLLISIGYTVRHIYVELFIVHRNFFPAYVSPAASLRKLVRYYCCGGWGAKEKTAEEIAMDLRTDSSRKIPLRPVIECAQCGDRLYIPEWSELVDARRMRHLWTCDSCGYQFETTVRFRDAA
jgi:hypothetical protein